MDIIKPVIGVIGGIGPHASLDLIHKVMSNTDANGDLEHIPIVLQSIPKKIPDRNDFLIGKSNLNPATAIIESIGQLMDFGANTFVIACNAAHSPEIFDPIQEAFNTRFESAQLLSIIDAVKEEVKNDLNENFGIMSVIGTYHSEVYHKAILSSDKNIIRLPDELRLDVHDLICDEKFGIKSFPDNITDFAYQKFEKVSSYFAAHNAEKVILACTELPLIDTKVIERNLGLSFMDATEIFARYIIQKTYPEKLKEKNLSQPIVRNN